MRRLVHALSCVVVIGCNTAPADPCGDLIEDRVLGRCVCPPDTVQSEDGWSCLLPDGGMIVNPNAPDAGSNPDSGRNCDGCDADRCVDGVCVRCTRNDQCPAVSPICTGYECVPSCDSDDECSRFERTPACATEGPLSGQCVECDTMQDCRDPRRPACDATANICGGCRVSEDCEPFEGAKACANTGPRSGWCVECASNEDCPSVAAPRCNPTTNTCTQCQTREDCTGHSLNECVDGRCVACTEETAAVNCGVFSCDPATLQCTMTPRNSVEICRACVSDSECRELAIGDDMYRCVPMEHAGVTRPTGYCLRLLSAGCLRPFTVVTPSRPSVSGAVADVYCGVLEERTTCEAVLDMIDQAACTADVDCGVPGLADGRCETVSRDPNRCSIDCGAAVQCPVGVLCGGSGSYCGAP